LIRIVFLLLVAALAAWPAEYQAGVARVKITPPVPVWLSGYAARQQPAASVGQELYAKALVIQDSKGGRVVLVTADLLGFTREVTDEVARRAAQRYGLRRDQLVFNASHTHSGPAVYPRLLIAGDIGPAAQDQARRNTEHLVEDLTALLGEALTRMVPVRLRYAETEVGFAANRRVAFLKQKGIADPPAPVDHRVPVLRVTSTDGQDRAVLFGYACHNTTLTGEFRQVSGDYAGYAQEGVERAFPGAIAMFVMLAGADQNPEPRSRVELAAQHGESLAVAVRSSFRLRKVRRITGRIQTAWREVELPLERKTQQEYEQEAAGPDPFAARRGRLALSSGASGIRYPVQAVRFGKSWALVALAGEVVVDYSLRVRREFGPKVSLAGYTNDLPGYVPSRRVWEEGGYEGGGAMVYFSQPGRFTGDVEDRVMNGIEATMRELGWRRRK
jgi:hypothetical protein